MAIHEGNITLGPAAAGLAALAETGIDPENIDRIATIQLNAGGKCVGPLVEFIGIEAHAPIKAGVVDTINKAALEGADVVEAVEAQMGMFIKRDEQGQVVRATDVAEKK
jgi:hypothetical protein